MNELVLTRLIGDDHSLDKHRERQLNQLMKQLKFDYGWNHHIKICVLANAIDKKSSFEFVIKSKKNSKFKIITASHFIANGYVLKTKININKDFFCLIKNEAYKRFMITYILQSEDKLGRGDWKEVTMTCYLSTKVPNLRNHIGFPKSNQFMHLYSLSLNEIFDVFLTKINPKPI